ncbi:J domain-containing protein-like [Oppia nitens]|uniref:J domain-containing protein-like n=1 Tax=Oppia nitens TaxID=1686743 RepID=UPI0023DAAFDC|nr:J domain-containing protein-like [Oppia nitens]
MDNIFNYNKKHLNEDYYQILGCDSSSSYEQIVCEYKKRALLLHPDKHDNNEDHNDINSQELMENQFKQLVRAKNILTDPDMRQSYDKWRTSGMAISFDDWKRLGAAIHVSMHWRNNRQKDLMITSDDHKSCGSSSSSASVVHNDRSTVVWNSVGDNDLLRKFRNYEI